MNMSWLLVSWFLTFGYVPQQDEFVRNHKTALNTEYVATVASMGLSATAFDHFKIYTYIDNYQYTDCKSFGFLPYRIDYTFGGELTINSNISLIGEHVCKHKVSYTTGYQPEDYSANETKFFVKIQGNTHF